MRVAVWGAGSIGLALAYRLVGVEFVSDLLWINRSIAKVSARIVDLQHGLAFAPACASVRALPEAEATLDDVDLLILTQGRAVGPNETRAALVGANTQVIVESAAEALSSFTGVVLVVTNPVDAMAQIIHTQLAVPAHKVIGLGTVVETARLRAAIAGHLIPELPPRMLWPFAIGTHDEQVRVIRGALGPGLSALHERLWASMQREVVNAPARVKVDGRSTLHPVVEGIVAVARTIATNSSDIHTVSVRDDQTGLFFSVPASLGIDGLVARHIDGIDEDELTACRKAAARLQHGGGC
jgi:L-lactate dehydrogenase